MRKITYFLTILVLLAFINAGCVERKLTIKSDPPGADVYFNDKHMGETPVDFDFEWYWTHKVRLEREGYQTVTNYETIKAPPYMWIPFDLVVEVLPLKVRDYRDLTYQLKPQQINESEKQQEIEKEEFDFNE